MCCFPAVCGGGRLRSAPWVRRRPPLPRRLQGNLSSDGYFSAISALSALRARARRRAAGRIEVAGEAYDRRPRGLGHGRPSKRSVFAALGRPVKQKVAAVPRDSDRPCKSQGRASGFSTKASTGVHGCAVDLLAEADMRALAYVILETPPAPIRRGSHGSKPPNLKAGGPMEGAGRPVSILARTAPDIARSISCSLAAALKGVLSKRFGVTSRPLQPI
jgi:hypothetical protein